MSKKTTVTQKTSTTKKVAAKKNQNVDYYPNRMTVAISALAGVSLVLFAVFLAY